jgi:hypothetical protein
MLRGLAIQSPGSRRARFARRRSLGRRLGRSLRMGLGRLSSGRGHRLRKRFDPDFSSRDSILGACRAAWLARRGRCRKLRRCRDFGGIFWRIFRRIFGSFRLLSCIFKNCRGLLTHF